jgi:hypothetical protein
LTAALTAGPAGWDGSTLPRPILEAGLKAANCTIPRKQAKIVGTEMLSSRLGIVEVTCWRTLTNSGSILFAVPLDRPQKAELLSVDSWDGGQINRGYTVPSPGFDAKTRTLSATRKARDAGDCGTIQEMKWTGWYFRLLHVWNKDRCDGEPFEWDSRERWQVFPQRGLERQEKPDVQGKRRGGEGVALR